MSSGARARPEPRQPPRLPERYRLRRHIASGGMASVWYAEDRLLARPVAIKILAERFAHDRLAVRRFTREARAGARVCGHNHVVTVFDVGDTEPAGGHDGSEPVQRRAFIVMEYLGGGTVADAVRVGAVRRHEALRWLGEAASALDYAHGCGIVHRDIKPANFLLDRNRILHVADFGIARLVSEDTITSADQLFGTAAYLAPEQALGRPATSASDRYALAVAAFELLAGERPFAAKHFAAQARQHIEEEPPRASERNRSLPPAIDPILQRGMSKEADARFESAGELVASLQRALTEGAMSTTRRTAPVAARVAPTRPRHRGRAIALLALALVVTSVVAAALAARGGSDHHAPTKQARVQRTVASSTPRHRSARPRTTSARTTTTASASSTTTRSTTTRSTTTRSTSAPSASQLQLTGHQEMLDGDYQTAVDTLREAVSSSDLGSLTYAYALYDLGRSLVLSGDASGAIPVLQKRLKIPNQTPVVRQMLNQALRAAGQASPPPATQTPAPAPAPASGDHGSGHPKGTPAPTGGAGLAPRPSHGQRPADGRGVEHVTVAD